MLRNLHTTILYLSSISSNQAFKSLKDPSIRSQITSNITQNKQKLDTLLDVIFSLSHLQIQYLLALQNQHTIATGNRISTHLLLSFSDQNPSLIQYLYQKKWTTQTWKDYHILTSLFSDQEDKLGSQQLIKKQKQTFDFELTSIDPTQKIKIIKVIRQLLNLGLKDAKDIVDKAPTIFKKGKKQQGEKLKIQLEKNGCVVTIK